MSWLANALTISRGVLGLVTGWAILKLGADDDAVWRVLPFVIFTLAALTDYFDGIVARRFNSVSALGARLDPISDKILVAASLLTLCYIDGWRLELLIPTVAIVGRDTVITLIRESRGNPASLKVSSLAKWKTAGELGGIGLLLGGIALAAIPGIQSLPAGEYGLMLILLASYVLIWIAALLSVWTGWRYIEAMMADAGDAG